MRPGAAAPARGAGVVGACAEPGAAGPARRAAPAVDVRVAVLSEPPFADGGFGAVVGNLARHHVGQQSQAAPAGLRRTVRRC